MRPIPTLVATAALALIALAALDRPPARAASHCAGMTAKITPIGGAHPGFVAETPHGNVVLYTPPHTAGVPGYEIDAEDATWDADQNPLTIIDTLRVPIGATVRWHLVTGVHTLTNGLTSSDPQAGSKFDYLLRSDMPDFDSTFTVPDTLNYFCRFHEPDMWGVLIVQVPVATRPTSWGALKRRFR
jgi:plastocyanin